MCICVCMYACINISIYVGVIVNLYMYVYICVCMCLYVWVCMYVCVRACQPLYKTIYGFQVKTRYTNTHFEHIFFHKYIPTERERELFSLLHGPCTRWLLYSVQNGFSVHLKWVALQCTSVIKTGLSYGWTNTCIEFRHLAWKNNSFTNVLIIFLVCWWLNWRWDEGTKMQYVEYML